jgi:hypothetical protein
MLPDAADKGYDSDLAGRGITPWMLSPALRQWSRVLKEVVCIVLLTTIFR